MDYEYLFKIILVGEKHVGKTSIVKRFHEGVFENEYKTTIGVDFAIQTLLIDKELVKLQIWDTCGQERFYSITGTYFRNADGILLVYDVTDREALTKAHRWLTKVKQSSKDNTVNLLIGNKADLTEQRRISLPEAEAFAGHHGMIGHVETSAKSDLNIDQAFYRIAQELLWWHGATSNPLLQQDDAVLLNQTPQDASWWPCCGYT